MKKMIVTIVAALFIAMPMIDAHKPTKSKKSATKKYNYSSEASSEDESSTPPASRLDHFETFKAKEIIKNIFSTRVKQYCDRTAQLCFHKGGEKDPKQQTCAGIVLERNYPGPDAIYSPWGRETLSYVTTKRPQCYQDADTGHDTLWATLAKPGDLMLKEQHYYFGKGENEETYLKKITYMILMINGIKFLDIPKDGSDIDTFNAPEDVNRAYATLKARYDAEESKEKSDKK